MVKKKTDTVEHWIGEINNAVDKRLRIERQYEWEKLKGIWNNGGADISVTTRSDRANVGDNVQSSFVNWVWAYGQAFIPAVFWKNPTVFVNPKASQFVANAKIADKVINAAFDQTNIKEVGRQCILDGLLFGIGWAKVGWYTEMGQVPAKPVSGGKVSELDIHTSLVQDEPYVLRVSPWRIQVDPYAPSYDEARWVAQEHFLLMEAVKKDPYLKNTDSVTASKFKLDGESDLTQSKRPWTRMWEIWDRENRKVLFICEGSSKFNRVVEPWPYDDLRGFPYVRLSLTDAVDSLYAPSPILPWLPLVEELAFLRSTRMDHISRMVNKYIASPESLDEDQVRDFLDPEIELSFANNPAEIQEFRGIQPDHHLYASEEQVKADIREISGYSELLSGAAPPSRTSATTAAIMERNSTLRFDAASERVGKFLTDCAEKLFVVVRKFQSYPALVRLTSNPQAEFLNYKQGDIEGDFYFSINVEDMATITRQQKIKNAYDKLVALAQFPEIKRWHLIRDLIEAFGVHDVDEYLKPEMGLPVDPSYENELMFRGIPVRPNPNEDLETHLQIHSQFIQSPEYLRAVNNAPQISNLFNEHIQETLSLLNLKQQTLAKPGISPSIQQGRSLASSAPQGGAKNTRGPEGNPLAQALQGFGGLS